MDLDKAIKTRRSIRKYTSQPVEKEKILSVIEAGRWAPTACNEQDYHFIILQKEQTLQAISALGAASFLKKVQNAVLVTYKNSGSNTEYKDTYQSGSACVQNMLLKAHDLGLGACWVCNLPSQARLRRLLDIPSSYTIIALVTLGHASGAAREVKRKQTMDECVSYERFSRQEGRDYSIPFGLRLKRVLRWIYFRLPNWKFIMKLANKLEKKFSN